MTQSPALKLALEALALACECGGETDHAIYAEAKRELEKFITETRITFTGCDEARHTMIAALRFWQASGMCNPTMRNTIFEDLATNNNEVTSLCEEDVDALVEGLNICV